MLVGVIPFSSALDCFKIDLYYWTWSSIVDSVYIDARHTHVNEENMSGPLGLAVAPGLLGSGTS